VQFHSIKRNMNLCSEEKEKAIKSQRAGELEALRMKGLAQERRTWLKDCKFFLWLSVFGGHQSLLKRSWS
jgi:hypothetical protein